MPGFRCPGCSGETSKLIGTKDGLKCPNCFDVTAIRHDGLLHAKQGSRRTGTVISVSDAMRIKTNRRRADGQYRPDWRWRTSGD